MYGKFATNGNERVYTVHKMQKGYDMSVCTYAHYLCVSFAFVKKQFDKRGFSEHPNMDYSGCC